jgi:hypothetical protein
MLPVRITVDVRRRAVPVEELADRRLASALAAAAADVVSRLSPMRCPVHAQSPTNVRIHFDERGNADLRYDSCCAKLGERIRALLGG